jgi:hypothetical protein
MAEAVASVVLVCAAAYVGVGLVFAVVFVVRWVGRVDHAAAGSDWRFRLMILPGAVALWPLLVRKVLKAARRAEGER